MKLSDPSESFWCKDQKLSPSLSKAEKGGSQEESAWTAPLHSPLPYTSTQQGCGVLWYPWAGVALALSFIHPVSAGFHPPRLWTPNSPTMLSRINQCCRLLSARPWGAVLWRPGMQELQSAAPVTPRMLAMLARLKRPRKLRSTKPFRKRLCSVDRLWGTLSCGTAWKLSSELHGGSLHESSLMLGWDLWS